MTTVEQLIKMLQNEPNWNAPVTGKIRIKRDKSFLTLTLYKGRRP
jgi:hypothetical protein